MNPCLLLFNKINEGIKMSLETVHLQFDHQGEHYDLTFREQEKPTAESVQINGRQFAILGESSQMAFLRGAISDLSSEKDMPPSDLRGRLSSLADVKNLSVESSLTSAELAARMEAYIRKMADERGYSGSVLVKKNGERLVFQGYGAADAATPNTPQTRFCIGSVTKQFTGVAIMLLIQEGRLALNDKINTVLPERFRNRKWEGITVRHLLTHATGIPDYGPSPGDEDRASFFTLDEIIAQFSDRDPAFNPGEMFEYSNANYALLGAIIEESSKPPQSYEDFMRDHIFHRAGSDMRNTGMYSSYAAALPATGFYLDDDGKLKSVEHRAMPIHVSKAHAAGAIISTLEDMEKWDRALYDDTFLTPASRKEIANAEGRIIFNPKKKSYDHDAQGRAIPKAGEEYDRTCYGFGVFVEGNGEALLHPGGIPGFTSFIARNTDAKDCVVVLGNQCRDDGSPIKTPVTQVVALHLWEMLKW